MGIAFGGLAVPALRAQPNVEITVHYSQPHVFRESKEAVAAAFSRHEPGIRINWVTTPNYDEGTQLILRQAVAGTQADLTYQGLNRLRVLAERGICQDLTPFLNREGNPANQGYSETILGLGRTAGMQAGLAYAVSTMITYMNLDVLRDIGVDARTFPTKWDGVLDLAARIARLPNAPDPLYYDIGEWAWSALLYGHGGQYMSGDERRFLMDTPQGLAAMRLYQRILREGRMPNLNTPAAQQAFGAGRIGIRFGSTAFLRNVIQSVGQNFPLATTIMPVIDAERGRLQVGGSAGMLLTRDPVKQEAAWKFLRFSTSAEGTALMVQNTGYVPCNQMAVDDPRWLGEFYRANPLFSAAMRQLPITVAWYAFAGTNGVRISQTISDNLQRLVEARATPEQVVQDMQREVTRLLPRAS
ncbi:MAG: extracellular solute-binding protein [Alphaproteobacteria bacterium]